MIDPHDLADRLRKEGKFEIYRASSPDDRSKKVWLTEIERDLIVDALLAHSPADGGMGS